MFLFFVQDIAHNVLDGGLQLAGFQVTPTGRFWVTPEGKKVAQGLFTKRKAEMAVSRNTAEASHVSI